MKKAFLFSLLFIAALPLNAAFAANVVSGVEGQPVIVRDGQEQPAAVGMEVKKGDKVKTVAGSRADVSLNGAAGVRLLAESEAVLKEVSDTNTQIDLEVGNVIVNLKKKLAESDRFEVETPTAVLAVRGTQFWGQVTPQGEAPKTVFAVREGALNVKDKVTAEEWMVTKGGAIEITGDGKPALTRSAAVAELDAIAQAEEIKIEE
jgi:hypothetical protein